MSAGIDGYFAGYMSKNAAYENFKGRGRMGGPKAGGPGGKCVCPACGTEVEHGAGDSCAEKNCPECETAMTRK